MLKNEQHIGSEKTYGPKNTEQLKWCKGPHPAFTGSIFVCGPLHHFNCSSYHVASISHQFRRPIYWNAHASSSFDHAHWGYNSVFKQIWRCSVDGRKRYENDKCGRKYFWKWSKTAPFENGLVWAGPKKTTTATATATAKSLNKNLWAEQWLCTCVLTLCTFPCRPLQYKNLKWLNFALSGERELRRIIF